MGLDQPAAEADERTGRESAVVAWMRSQLSPRDWRLAGDLWKAAENEGFSPSEVARAVAILGVLKDRGGAKKRLFWRLPRPDEVP